MPQGKKQYIVLPDEAEWLKSAQDHQLNMCSSGHNELPFLEYSKVCKAQHVLIWPHWRCHPPHNPDTTNNAMRSSSHSKPPSPAEPWLGQTMRDGHPAGLPSTYPRYGKQMAYGHLATSGCRSCALQGIAKNGVCPCDRNELPSPGTSKGRRP
jgi:hypothetical protein